MVIKKTWKQVTKGENKFLKVFVSTKGDVNVVYPTAPKWAQKVAYEIWKDAQSMPTRKGVKDIVKGLWAKMISEAARENKNGV